MIVKLLSKLGTSASRFARFGHFYLVVVVLSPARTALVLPPPIGEFIGHLDRSELTDVYESLRRRAAVRQSAARLPRRGANARADALRHLYLHTSANSHAHANGGAELKLSPAAPLFFYTGMFSAEPEANASGSGCGSSTGCGTELATLANFVHPAGLRKRPVSHI